MIRVLGAIWMSPYGDAHSRRQTCCPRPRKNKDSSRAKHEPRTWLERAEAGMPEMLSLMVKTKQCSNEQQLTSNVPVAGSHNRLLWVEIEISENNHSIWTPKERRNRTYLPSSSLFPAAGFSVARCRSLIWRSPASVSSPLWRWPEPLQPRKALLPLNTEIEI